MTNFIRSLRPSEPLPLRDIAVPALIAGVALAASIAGALIVGGGDGLDSINYFVERLSGGSGSSLGGLTDSESFLGGLISASALFALSAGMVSSVNPCGFAMLPAYLGMYLGQREGEQTKAGPAKHFGKALLIGGTVTLGFLLLFGVVGTLIGVGASFVGDLLPWLGLVIGIGLAIAGAWLVGGGKLYSGLAARAASHIGNPGDVGIKGYFMFGLSYGTASLGCTLPIFLAVVGISGTGASIASIAQNFFLFALGMGLVIMALTLGMAFFKGAMVGMVRKALPFVQPFGAWMMVIAGAYLVFYWLTVGGLL